MDDYVRHLFAYVDLDRISMFGCGHVIPKENLITLPVAKGPGNTEFNFTFEKRNSPTMIEALGKCLIELSTSIPDGLVVFFPSYAYLDQVIRSWQVKSTGATEAVWGRLFREKPVFRESKTTIGSDEVLTEYSQAISNGKGGLLLSVIGGKMSEGINFSDSLGRGIVVVGLPFPNMQSAQWKAKLEFIETQATNPDGSPADGKAAAREFYENACMRAVNQCIGRAIRHKGDYASILLLDRRYTLPKITAKLPCWIRQGLMRDEAFGDYGRVVNSLKIFYAGKKGD